MNSVEFSLGKLWDTSKLLRTVGYWSRDSGMLPGAAAVAALARRGFFPREDLLHWGEVACHLQGHPDRLKTPGVDMTTGSLGQGLSAGLGMALGLRLKRFDSRVFVMLGDGELNEGQVWEAAMAAARFNLDHLTVIVDYNDLQLDGFCHDVMPLEPLAAKWRDFGWNVLEIDGHDMHEILEALQEAQHTLAVPTVIIAHTIKGKGISFMENDCEWHGRAPNDREYAAAMAELAEEGAS